MFSFRRWELSGPTADCFDIDMRSHPDSWTSSSWSGSGWGIVRQREQCDISQVLPECRQPFSPLWREKSSLDTAGSARESPFQYRHHYLFKMDGTHMHLQLQPRCADNLRRVRTDLTAKLCSGSADRQTGCAEDYFWGDLGVLHAAPQGCF